MSQDPKTYKDIYSKHLKEINIVQDVYNGTTTAVGRIRKYPDESDTKYKERKEDAALNNFVFKTIDTIKNVIFRKDIDLENIKNNDLLWYMDSIDLKNDIDNFSKRVLSKRIRDGYTFIMVDSPQYDTELIRTKQDRQLANIRPYLVSVDRKSVINWQGEDIELAKWVVISETYTEQIGKFDEEIKEQYRVLYNDGTIEIYRESELYETFQTGYKGLPLIKIGNDLTPPLLDHAKLNINHLNRNSELDNYIRVGGAPFIGVGGQMAGDDKQPLTLGINSGMRFKDDNWKAEWIEMSGANAEMIENRIVKYEDAMLTFSIELLTDDTIKTATQVSKESAAKESKLKHYSRELEEGINRAIEIMGDFQDGISGENFIIVNKDFDSAILQPQEAAEIRADYLAGLISLDTVFDLYEKGERLPRRTDQEREAEKLLLRDSGIE